MIMITTHDADNVDVLVFLSAHHVMIVEEDGEGSSITLSNGQVIKSDDDRNDVVEMIESEISMLSSQGGN